MAYATLDDLIGRAGAAEIGNIADRDRDGTPDTEVVNAAITDAGMERAALTVFAEERT